MVVTSSLDTTDNTCKACDAKCSHCTGWSNLMCT